MSLKDFGSEVVAKTIVPPATGEPFVEAQLRGQLIRKKKRKERIGSEYLVWGKPWVIYGFVLGNPRVIRSDDKRPFVMESRSLAR